MASYASVQAALGAAIGTYSPALALNTYTYVPRSLVPPAAIIQPQAHKTIDYMVLHGSSHVAKWYFTVQLVIGQVDEEAAQEQAGVLISPGSDFIAALNSTAFPNGGYAKVTEGAVSQMMFADGLYTYAQLSVYIQA